MGPEIGPTRQAMRPLRAILLTLAAAGLLSLAFLPLGVSVLAWVALAPWLAACASVGLLVAFRLGMLFAVVGSLGLIYWCPGALADFFSVPAAWAWAGVVTASLLAVAVYWAPFAVWVAWAAARGRINPWLIAGGWAFCEYARNHGLFPWALLAYSQPPGSALLQGADLAGPYGIGALMAAVSAVVAGLFAPRLRPRRFGVHALAVALLVFSAWLYGEWRLGQRFGNAEELEVALVQPHFDRHQRWLPEYRIANFQHSLELSRRAAESEPDIILWPEFAVEGTLPASSALVTQLQRHSKQMTGDLVVGAPYGERGDALREGYNSAFLFRDGALLDRYDKQMLVPFTERNILPAFVDDTPDNYQAGTSPEPLALRSARLGATVCWDGMHPELIRELVDKGADVLANLSRDEWLGSSTAARQQLDAVALRAVESRRWLVRPTAGGYTALVDPHGRVVELGNYGEPDVVFGTLQASHVRTPYHRFGDWLPWLGGLLAIVWPLVPSRRLHTQPAGI
ncbi:MAG: apolipoprotein N-acyltransferase [Myxococcota bacterium]